MEVGTVDFSYDALTVGCTDVWKKVGPLLGFVDGLGVSNASANALGTGAILRKGVAEAFIRVETVVGARDKATVELLEVDVFEGSSLSNSTPVLLVNFELEEAVVSVGWTLGMS